MSRDSDIKSAATGTATAKGSAGYSFSESSLHYELPHIGVSWLNAVDGKRWVSTIVETPSGNPHNVSAKINNERASRVDVTVKPPKYFTDEDCFRDLLLTGFEDEDGEPVLSLDSARSAALMSEFYKLNSGKGGSVSRSFINLPEPVVKNIPKMHVSKAKYQSRSCLKKKDDSPAECFYYLDMHAQNQPSFSTKKKAAVKNYGPQEDDDNSGGSNGGDASGGKMRYGYNVIPKDGFH